MDRASILYLNSVSFMHSFKRLVSQKALGKLVKKKTIQLRQMQRKSFSLKPRISVPRWTLGVCMSSAVSALAVLQIAPFRKSKYMPENRYKKLQTKWPLKPTFYTGWRTTGGTHPLAPYLFSINGTKRNRINSRSCSN